MPKYCAIESNTGFFSTSPTALIDAEFLFVSSVLDLSVRADPTVCLVKNSKKGIFKNYFIF
jgi:hypothetical protein